jgi:hypothetical protein
MKNYTTPTIALVATLFLAGCGDETEPEQVDPLGCEAAESTLVVNPQDNPRGIEGDSRNLGPLVETERGFFAIRPVEDREHDAFVYNREGGGYEYGGYFDYQGFALGAVAEDYVSYSFNSEAPRDGDKVGRLQVIDLAVPGQPVVASEIEIALDQTTCYAPPLLGRARVAKSGDKLFFPCETQIATVDVSDPCAPAVESFDSLPDLPDTTPIEHEMVLVGETDEQTVRLYVITRLRESNARRLGVYEVSDTVTELGSVQFDQAPRSFYDVEVRDGKLFAVNERLHIVDVSNPASMQVLSTTDLEGQSGGFDFRDGKLWMTLLTPEPELMRFVQRWDVSDPSSPMREESWDVGAQFSSLWDLQIRRGDIYASGVTLGGSGVQEVVLE